MAVENKYTDSFYTGTRATRLLRSLSSGTDLRVAFATFEVAAADDNNSIYRVFKSLDPNIVPLAILIGCDAITAGNDYNLGLYRTNLGAVIDDNCFADAIDLSSALDLGFATALDGMDAVDIADYGKRLYEHAGHTVANKLDSYDMAFIGITVGTAAGTVSTIMIYAHG